MVAWLTVQWLSAGHSITITTSPLLSLNHPKIGGFSFKGALPWTPLRRFRPWRPFFFHKVLCPAVTYTRHTPLPWQCDFWFTCNNPGPQLTGHLVHIILSKPILEQFAHSTGSIPWSTSTKSRPVGLMMPGKIVSVKSSKWKLQPLHWYLWRWGWVSSLPRLITSWQLHLGLTPWGHRICHGLVAFSIVNQISNVQHFRSELTLLQVS